MPGAGCLTGDDLPSSAPARAQAEAPAGRPGPSALGARARGRARGAALGAVPRLLPGAGLGDPAGRGPLPGFGADDVPAACRTPARCGSGATSCTHPGYAKPELLAERPNELWSWDIIKLKGPAKWTYFHLYVILDVFSRYGVGWTVQHRESAQLAKALIAKPASSSRSRAGS